MVRVVVGASLCWEWFVMSTKGDCILNDKEDFGKLQNLKTKGVEVRLKAEIV